MAQRICILYNRNGYLWNNMIAKLCEKHDITAQVGMGRFVAVVSAYV